MKLNDFFIKWPVRIAIIIGGLGVIALYSYRAVSTPTIKTINISRSKNVAPLSVGQANIQTLSPNILSSNSPASSAAQSGLSTSSQGSSTSLQSNLNVNDSSLSNNPLIESLYSSGQ